MLTSRIPTVYIGTTVEGLSTLEYLARHPRIDLRAVITQPDRPFGRKKILKPTIIKEYALAHDIPVITPESAADYQRILSEEHPEFAVCIAFGQFLPGYFLSSLKHTCLNVHYSLLPLLRGAVPVQAAILQNLKTTGVTVQVMEEQMDVGPVIIQKEVPIESNETTPTLKEKLIPLGRDLIEEILEKWIDGKITPEEQNDSHATYCYMRDISREKACIDWKNTEPEQIERMVRALLPWPVAWTELPDGRSLKIIESKLVEDPSATTPAKPGDILPRTDGLFFVTNTPGTVLNALTVQPEGKQQMSGSAFLRGIKVYC